VPSSLVQRLLDESVYECVPLPVAVTDVLDQPSFERRVKTREHLRLGTIARRQQQVQIKLLLGNQGLQGGWAIDNQGHVNFVHSLTQQLPLIEEAGAGAVRVNFRLGECFSNWTAVGCANADEPRTALGLYDQVVNAALQRNLKVVGLISNESWHGTQAEWTASNAENAGGSGDNAYIRSFATNAAGVLASHFAGRVTTWEVWNEPNAYSESPSPGVYTGSSFMYPSNFAWLLKRSYAAIKTHQPGTSSTVVSGGLFGHDIGGASVVVTNPEGTRQRITKRGTVEMEKQLSPQALDKPLASGPTCTSNVPSRADYLCSTYRMGQTKAGWKKAAYPMDAIGQHLYIDQGGITTSSKLTIYLQDVRKAYVAFEGASTPKKTQITEFGWVANPDSQYYAAEAGNQAQNVKTAYTTFKSTSFVTRADYFVVQDVPEAPVFYGLAQGDGTTHKPAFAEYQRWAAY